MMKRIVVKLGTSVLTGGSPRLYRPQMVEIARQCSILRQAGHEIVICSSGAVAAGREALNFPTLPPTVTSKQMLAAVGQSRLMQVWGSLFDIYQQHVGQVLLTRADVDSRSRYLNARDTLHALLEQGIIPIINENDAVATEEIKVGDNDNLSALVAVLVEADYLYLLTDQEGLFTADPRSDPTAQLISVVQKIDHSVWSIAGGSVTGLGVGGMVTKLQSAETATRAGIDVIIASGKEPNIVTRLAHDEPIGTRFVAQENRLENRHRWLLAGSKPVGKLVVDQGAMRALIDQGRSLLPIGITSVEGEFQRGDTVAICNLQGTEIARGIVRYASDALDQIKQSQSHEIQEKLGYTYGNTAVHRNDMIITRYS